MDKKPAWWLPLLAATCTTLAACGGGGGAESVALPAAVTLTASSAPEPGQAVTLTSDIAATEGLTFAWQFGDGKASAEAAPSHTYGQPGTYEVTLTLTNGAGETRTVTHRVTVSHASIVQGLLCSEAEGGGWCWQRPKPTGNRINAVVMDETGTGWAVGDAGTLLKTTDGGTSWSTRSTRVSAALSSIGFVDANTGWVVASDRTLWKTVDGGERWAAQALPPELGPSLSGLKMIDTQRLVASGLYGKAATSSDGGQTWRVSALLPEAFTPDGSYFGFDGSRVLKSTDLGATFTPLLTLPPYVYSHQLAFADAQHGWLLVSVWDVFTTRLELWRTNDGGATWQASSPVGLDSTSYYSAQLTFFNANDGWFTTGYAVYRTTDGGLSWTPAILPGEVYGSIGTPTTLDAATLWFSHNGAVYLTADGARSWQKLQPSEEAGFGWYYASSPVYQRSGSHALLQYGSRVYRSSDGGQTWQRILGGEAKEQFNRLQALWFFDARTGVAVGDDGSMLRTTDGGQQWTRTELASAWSGTARLQFIDAQTGWVLPASGTLAMTVDGGAHWSTPLAVTPLSGVTDFHFIDARRGWAVGYGGMQSTSDGGYTWQPQALPGENFYAVRFASPTVGLAVGYGGGISRTGDGGKSWTLRSSGTTANLRRVVFSNATTAWAVGDGGTVLRSDDAGDSWRRVNTLASITFNDVHFVDTLNGWIVGDEGAVLATRDGGASWSPQESGTPRSLQSVFALDPMTAWIVGEEGLVLATARGGSR